MHNAETRPRWVVPMKPRSPDETHRTSTPLELLFDLVFVIAVAQAASALHHGVAEGHAGETLLSYVLVFFGIWWAWMNFTWFAASYDNDDIPYRLLVFVQMTGALIVASGVERIFTERDLTVTVIGYVIMRVAGVIQWLRAAASDPVHRPAALRYGAGIGLVQVAWVGLLVLPPNLHVPGFLVLVVVELLIPIWAEVASPTTWNLHHIRERYSLFTLILLGESILSTSNAIKVATDEGEGVSDLLGIIVGGLLIVYSMWWLYFYQPVHNFVNSLRDAFVWAYGHILVYASTAAVGAGIAVVIDQLTHHAEISPVAAGMALAVPTAIYVVSLWVLQEHPLSHNKVDVLVHPVTAVLILLAPFTGQTVPLIGGLMVALVVIRLIRHLE